MEAILLSTMNFPKRRQQRLLAFLFCLAALDLGGGVASEGGPLMKLSERTFASLPRASSASPYIDDVPLVREKFKLVLPTNLDKTKSYGLVVYMSASNDGQPPLAWDPVLAQRDLLMISPVGVGNDQPIGRRLGLGIAAVRAMQREYRIDPKRIYAAGMSGGARVACNLAFHRPELISGTIQSVGSDFLREVPRVKATGTVDTQGNFYGVARGPEAVNVALVKRNVRFVIVTGPGDFRYGNLLDIYNGGFKKDGYQTRLLDIPGMGHEVCSAAAFAQALDFIEAGRP